MYKSITKSHYYVVDLIRIAAAAMVVLYHFAAFENAATGAVVFPFLWPFGLLDGVGGVGVEIFFVISGLVIAMSAENASGLQGALRFIRLRASRILPALWISTLIGFVFLAISGVALPTLLLTVVKSATLSPIGPYIDGVVWSLVVEAVFYITVAVAIVFSPRLSLENLAKMICAVSTVYLIVWPAAFFVNDHAFELLSRFPSKVFLLRHGVFFALGMLLWSTLRGHRSASTSWTMVIASVMCVVEILTTQPLHWVGGFAAAGIWFAAVAIMVASIVHADAIERRLGVRQRKIVRYLGRFSYPLYLNHYTFGALLLQLLLRIFHPVSQLSVILVLIMLTVGVLAMAAFVTSAEKVVGGRFRLKPLVTPVAEPTSAG